MDEITKKIERAKQIACSPCVALGNRPVTTGHAKSLNITVNGPVCIKHDGAVIVPIDVFSFTSFKSYSKKVVLNSDLSFNRAFTAKHII